MAPGSNELVSIPRGNTPASASHLHSGRVHNIFPFSGIYNHLSGNGAFFKEGYIDDGSLRAFCTRPCLLEAWIPEWIFIFVRFCITPIPALPRPVILLI